MNNKEMSLEKLNKYKNRLERRINRNQIRIKDLKERESNLSVHGYWDLGYFEGQQSILEDLLDDVKELLGEEI